MRTVRSSSRLCSGGVHGPGGCMVSLGCMVPRGGVYPCTEADPPVNRMTDRCKNITFATLLRTVIREVTDRSNNTHGGMHTGNVSLGSPVGTAACDPMHYNSFKCNTSETKMNKKAFQ